MGFSTPSILSDLKARSPFSRSIKSFAFPSTFTVADAAWKGLRPFQEILAQRGLSHRIGVIVPDIYSAMAVAARSNMATLVPRRLGRMSEQLGALRLIEPPHPTPDLRVSLMALRERLGEPALAWMHDLLVEVGTTA